MMQTTKKAKLRRRKKRRKSQRKRSRKMMIQKKIQDQKRKQLNPQKLLLLIKIKETEMNQTQRLQPQKGRKNLKKMTRNRPTRKKDGKR